jgi:hypothetical protein
VENLILLSTGIATEEYDGNSWATSVGTSMNTARNNLAASGIQTAALGFGGSKYSSYSSNRTI